MAGKDVKQRKRAHDALVFVKQEFLAEPALVHNPRVEMLRDFWHPRCPTCVEIGCDTVDFAIFKAERFWLFCHLCVEAFYIRVMIDVHLRTHERDDPALWRREVAVEIHREDRMDIGRVLDRLCRFLCDVCFGEVAQGHHDLGFGLAQNCADLLWLKQWVDRINDTCSHTANQGNGCFRGIWQDKRDNIAFPYTKTAEEIGGLTDLIVKLAPAQCLGLICGARHELITYGRTIRKLCRRPCEHFINRGWHITCTPRHFIGHV